MIKKITCDIYGVDIYVAIGMPYKRLVKMIKTKHHVILKESDVPEKADGASILLSTGYLLWIEKFNVSILAHEALHITQGVLEKHDIFLKHSTREVYAYYLGWLIDKITKKKR